MSDVQPSSLKQAPNPWIGVLSGTGPFRFRSSVVQPKEGRKACALCQGRLSVEVTNVTPGSESGCGSGNCARAMRPGNRQCATVPVAAIAPALNNSRRVFLSFIVCLPPGTFARKDRALPCFGIDACATNALRPVCSNAHIETNAATRLEYATSCRAFPLPTLHYPDARSRDLAQWPALSPSGRGVVELQRCHRSRLGERRRSTLRSWRLKVIPAEHKPNGFSAGEWRRSSFRWIHEERVGGPPASTLVLRLGHPDC